MEDLHLDNKNNATIILGEVLSLYQDNDEMWFTCLKCIIRKILELFIGYSISLQNKGFTVKLELLKIGDKVYCLADLIKIGEYVYNLEGFKDFPLKNLT